MSNKTKSQLETELAEAHTKIAQLERTLHELQHKISEQVVTEEKFSGIFQRSPVALTITRIADGKFLDVNEAFLRMFEYTRQDVIGHTSIELNIITPQTRRFRIDRQLVTGGLQNAELEARSKSGRTIHMLFSSSPIEIKSEPHHLTTIIDITDRKQAEAALKESEERFAKAFFTSPVSQSIIALETNEIIEVNDACCHLFGYSRAELIGAITSKLNLWSSAAERQSAVEELQSTGHLQPREVSFQGKTGETHTGIAAIEPISWKGAPCLISFVFDITERKQAEQEAIDRQKLLEKVIQLGKDIAILTDLDRCLLEIYKSARFGLGFDRVGLFLYDASLDHLLGVYGTSRTGELEEPGFFDGPLQKFGSWERALQSPSGISWLDDYQKHFNIPEGHAMHGVGQHVVVAAWAGEKPVALIAVDNLLSGRKIKPAEVEALQLFAGYAGLAIENASLHAELELKVEERTAEVQDLYDNAPTGYHSVDINGCLIQINQTELSWLGYTKEEVLGHPLTEFITEESRLVFQERFPRFKQNGVLHDLQFEMVRKDGSTFPVVINATAIRDGQGRYISSRSTIFDNTEHKLAEDAVRQSEETYRALFQNANDGIFIFALDRSIQRVNPKGAELLGYPEEELIGMFDAEFLEPEHVADSAWRAGELIAGKRVPVYERKLRKKDGTWVETEINLSLIRDMAENPRFIQSVVRDVSTRKHAEETLRLANIELERALRLKDEFLASMSHELRTPLTGILGLSEALQYDIYGELSPKQKKVISNIESNGHHLLDLINDILDISKMEAGKLELEMAPCSLDDICQSSLQLVKGMAQKKGQRLTFSMNPAGIIVHGDPRRLKQIVVNLLSNAVKYSPEGKSVGLEIVAEPSTHTVRIDIWDHGIGIASEDLKRLFKPFVQLDSSLSRQQTGTGLGLALVQRLVDLHGGSIQVVSKPGQGSRFSVRLPYLQDMFEPHEEGRREVSSQIQQSLIVEDNAIDANRLTRFLRMLGIHAVVETRGQNVIEKAIAYQPAVILLDINLPDMSGWDVLEQLKQNPKTRAIPVVITSVVEERERASRLGAAGYLLKLFTFDELRLILSRIPKPVDARSDRALVVSPKMHSAVVMIVDDNETNILMVEDFLQSRNYQVFSSNSGFDFLARVEEISPDIILMDIQMPDMDGLETIRRLRQLPDPELAAAPVIAITALAMPGDRERCLEAGADEYISKPIRLKDVATLIQKLLLHRDDIHGSLPSNTD